MNDDASQCRRWRLVGGDDVKARSIRKDDANAKMSSRDTSDPSHYVIVSVPDVPYGMVW